MKRQTIPKDILLLPAMEMRKEKQSDPERWVTYDYEQLRAMCGIMYSNIPLDDLRLQCCNLRKAGMLGRVRNGRGIPTREPLSEEYLEYMESEQWKQLRDYVGDFWDWHCALCNSDNKVELHHRTYERFGSEKLTDVVLLCRRCHQAADRARQRNAKAPNDA